MCNRLFVGVQPVRHHYIVQWVFCRCAEGSLSVCNMSPIIVQQILFRCATGLLSVCNRFIIIALCYGSFVGVLRVFCWCAEGSSSLCNRFSVGDSVCNRFPIIVQQVHCQRGEGTKMSNSGMTYPILSNPQYV